MKCLNCGQTGAIYPEGLCFNCLTGKRLVKSNKKLLTGKLCRNCKILIQKRVWNEQDWNRVLGCNCLEKHFRRGD